MRGIDIKKKLRDNGYSLKKVAELMGETPQNLNSMLNAQDIKTGVVEKIATSINKSLYFFYSDKVELDTEMNTDSELNINSAVKSTSPFCGIPLITTNAMAGYMSGEVQTLEYECERYVVPIFKEAEFLIPIKGSSMYPKYNSGDIVACKRLPLGDIFFQWNKVYVIDTAQGALVKRIKKGSNDENILITSDNTAYEPFELHMSQINSVALVIGVIRLE